MTGIYTRNEKALGEEVNNKLLESRVILVGSGTLAQMILANLIGLGVGSIHLIDDAKKSEDKMISFLCDEEAGDSSEDNWRVFSISKRITREYPNINIDCRPSRINKKLISEIEKPQVIIDATNNKYSKLKCYKYSLEERIPLLLVSSSFYDSIVSFYNPYDGKDKSKNYEIFIQNAYHGLEQGSFSSGVIAGLVGDQIIKILASYDIENIIESYGSLYYNLLSKKRNDAKSNIDAPFVDDNELIADGFNKIKALVVGGGGIGNYVVLNLALLGCGVIDIIDRDYVEVENKNRQILIGGDVGEKKIVSLERRVKKINPTVSSKGIYHMLKGGEYDLFVEEDGSPKYDLIFGCVDNLDARLIINDLAIISKTPYIDGGVDLFSGTFVIYVPGSSKCIDCQIDLSGLRFMNEYEAKQNDETSCIKEVDPSIVPPNILIGSAMVGEAINFLFNKDYKQGIFMYDSNDRDKIRFLCYGDDEKKSFEDIGGSHGC